MMFQLILWFQKTSLVQKRNRQVFMRIYIKEAFTSNEWVKAFPIASSGFEHLYQEG
jgi:hypothetical protein